MTPEGYPRELVEVAILDDGTAVLVRPILPTDAAALERLHHRCSAATLYRRFFTVPTPTVEMLDRLATVDYVDRMALVAVIGDDLVGVARFDRLADPVEAEAALLVEDAWQQRGIGSRLLWRLAGAARERGIAVFVAAVLGENRPMMGLLAELGESMVYRLDGAEYDVRVVLGGVEPDTPATA